MLLGLREEDWTLEEDGIFTSASEGRKDGIWNLGSKGGDLSVLLSLREEAGVCIQEAEVYTPGSEGGWGLQFWV